MEPKDFSFLNEELEDEYGEEFAYDIDEELIQELQFEAKLEKTDYQVAYDIAHNKDYETAKSYQNEEKLSRRKKEASIHKGHRSRMIKKFLNYGLESFAEHEVLELLLFFTRRQGDTNPIAHRLINEFGSLHNVVRAEPHDLQTVEGVGENSATLIYLLRSIMAYLSETVDVKESLHNATATGLFCCNFFREHTEETFIVLHMDSNRALRHVSVISRGTENETAFYPRKVLREVIKHRSNMIVVSHNHTSNNLQPSPLDVKLTNDIADLLETIGVPLVDHIVCCGCSFTSMQERGLMSKKEKQEPEVK